MSTTHSGEPALTEGLLGVALPGVGGVLAKADDENFPVALRILSAATRDQLMAVYGFARLVDDVGDGDPGPGVGAQLDWLEDDLERAATGAAIHPLVRRLMPLLAGGIPLDPFRRLIEANRHDQQASRYLTFKDLRSYCELSAMPIGELVLRIFGVLNEPRLSWSDDVCIALQVVEHLQDLGEDARRGRVYLPAEDLERFGCSEAQLFATSAGTALREVVEFEADRCRRLLRSGARLARSLPIRPRLAIAGYTAGGLAALDAIVKADYDVLSEFRRAGRGKRVAHLGLVFAGWTSNGRAGGGDE